MTGQLTALLLTLVTLAANRGTADFPLPIDQHERAARALRLLVRAMRR